jgi:hypothetical protein
MASSTANIYIITNLGGGRTAASSNDGCIRSKPSITTIDADANAGSAQRK